MADPSPSFFEPRSRPPLQEVEPHVAAERRRDRVPAFPTDDPTAYVLEHGIVVDSYSGQRVISVMPMRSMDPRLLGRRLRSVRWGESAPRRGQTATGESRLSGLAASNSTFGNLPPVPLRRRYGCSSCAFDQQNPSLARLLEVDLARDCADAYRAMLGPSRYGEAVQIASRIPPAWRLDGGCSPWSSGIINNNTALPYHTDSSNLRGVWSALVVLRRHCEGGWLHVPSYNVWIPAEDGSIVIFDGARLLHGVSPFTLTNPAGYRFSIVFYARAGMIHCHPDPTQEPARAAAVASSAAAERLSSLAVEEDA